ncbi:maltose O-acetyltransferase [Bacillus sp. AFS077874]|uniref:acyltransferase n=1 Tax=Bacillus sp. AFS077874 TaxID=2033513 RepID=UPI000BFA27E2|nr:acyltransferase [Bacillus sp. AFS077874]PFM78977.1 maltose O-acetyltransferase [Bacillus sp. AFS077874]
MTKYLRAITCLVFSLIKFSFMKIFNFKKIQFTLFNLFSPFTEVVVGKNAQLALGKMVKARSGVKINVRSNAEVKIGEETFFNHGCMIICHEKISIGNNVQFGPNVYVYDHDHDFRVQDGLKSKKFKTSSVKIGNNVWIGANSVILRGTVIGDNCVVGAGCVIKGNYPDNTLIVQKRIEEQKEIQMI